MLGRLFGQKTLIPRRTEYRVGDFVDGKYKVQKLLGEGSFGQVYKVSDLQGNEFALKLLRLWEVPSDIREPLVNRFDMEFETGQIESEYLVQSLSHGFADDNPYILMEFCPGGDLTKMIGKDEADILKIASDVLHGLNALHINGKVHRDLKPENVLFKENGIAALTDFGIAGDRNRRMTERNIFGKPYQIFGTYAYMPPEQVNRARGGATVLPTTDIWSFGVMVYQMLTTKLPFGQLETQNDLVKYQKRGKEGDWDKPTLLAIPDGNLWYGLVEGCLQPDFKERLQNAREVLYRLPKLLIPEKDKMHYIKFSQPPISAPQREVQTQRLKKQAQLRVLHGDEYGKVYNLSEILREHGGGPLKMGRSLSNDICIVELHSNYISRFHCTLESDDMGLQWHLRDGQYREDLGQWKASSNGTYVNSTLVGPLGFWLEGNDIISIGDTKLRFENNMH